VKTLGASALATPYMIDLARREAQYLDPRTNTYTKLPFSSFM
jgi:hypothetical protein